MDTEPQHSPAGKQSSHSRRWSTPSKLLPDVLSKKNPDSQMIGLARTICAPSFRPGTPSTLRSGSAVEANSRFRKYMEDVVKIIDPFLSDEAGEDQWGYYAIYDGHGGSQAVDHVAKNLHAVICDELKAAKRGNIISDTYVAEALERSFCQIDAQLNAVGAWKCGSTATVALVHKTARSLRLHLANVGDSSAVLIDSAFHAHRISYDHRPTDVKEVLRIEAVGGFIARNRVNGQLGVSRALGDHCLKKSGVTSSPHVVTRDMADDVALVIASDGLWDVLTDYDVARIMEHNSGRMTPDQLADCFVRQAQRGGSTDNISCVVCLFDRATRNNKRWS
jgi:protein phosphatase PTC1